MRWSSSIPVLARWRPGPLVHRLENTGNNRFNNQNTSAITLHANTHANANDTVSAIAKHYSRTVATAESQYQHWRLPEKRRDDEIKLNLKRAKKKCVVCRG